jgi:hypothetical protein
MTKKSTTMAFIDTSNALDSQLTPQLLHREPAMQLEKVVMQHRHVTLLHDAKDTRSEEIHGGIAYKHIAQILEVSVRALNIRHW